MKAWSKSGSNRKWRCATSSPAHTSANDCIGFVWSENDVTLMSENTPVECPRAFVAEFQVSIEQLSITAQYVTRKINLFDFWFDSRIFSGSRSLRDNCQRRCQRLASRWRQRDRASAESEESRVNSERRLHHFQCWKPKYVWTYF